MVGSTLGCYSKGCTLRYHYLCAIEAGKRHVTMRLNNRLRDRAARPEFWCYTAVDCGNVLVVFFFLSFFQIAHLTKIISHCAVQSTRFLKKKLPLSNHG